MYCVPFCNMLILFITEGISNLNRQNYSSILRYVVTSCTSRPVQEKSYILAYYTRGVHKETELF